MNWKIKFHHTHLIGKYDFIPDYCNKEGDSKEEERLKPSLKQKARGFLKHWD